MAEGDERGLRWWVRHVAVPLLAGGGGAALIFLNYSKSEKTPPVGDPKPIPITIQIAAAPSANAAGIPTTPSSAIGTDIGNSNPAPSNPVPPTERKPEPPDASVGEFVSNFLKTWCLPNEEALAGLTDIYGDQVTYYGTIRSRSDVLNDKRRFTSVWVRRDYTIEPGTLRVTCGSDGLCEASGVMKWAAWRKDGSRHGGRSTFEYQIVNRHIIAESSAVVARD